jgi:hypothetical protein
MAEPFDELEEGEDFADWQLWLGTTGLRHALFVLELLGVAIAIGGIAWAFIGGPPYWIATLKIAGGVASAWTLFRIADFLHPIAVAAFNEFFIVRERRERQKDPRGFFLFLRSFHDDTFTVYQTVDTAAGRGQTTYTLDNLSDLLEHGLEKVGRFIMIGNEASADPFSDASVMAKTDDANWWPVFLRLLSGARAVFLVPERSVGLIQECKEVLNGPHREKAIVVMPRVDAQGLRALRWEALRTQLAQQGFELPPYDPRGCFYMPDVHLRPVSTFPFGYRHTPFAMRRAFRRIEPLLPRNTTPFREAYSWIELAPGAFPTEVRAFLERRWQTNERSQS